MKKSLDEDDNLSKYNAIKNELDAVYNQITEAICIRSICDWYEHSKKSTKFFLNLEKQQEGTQNTIKKLIVDDKEITDQTHILECIREFYENLFKNHKQKTAAEIKSFLRHLNIPKLSEDKSKLCEEDLTEKDLYDSLKSMEKDKSPGYDGLTKEFYETFWKKLKEISVDSVVETKEKVHFMKIYKSEIYKKLETHFLNRCRSKNNIKSSFRETNKSFTRFNIFTANCVC